MGAEIIMNIFDIDDEFLAGSFRDIFGETDVLGNGEILKIDSKEGPTVASQIASTFNNLLDVIAPATQELYL